MSPAKRAPKSVKPAAEPAAPASPSGGGVRVRFWGVRGSIPAPGPKTVRYGGNTSCVEIRSGDHVYVCDTGTGVRELGLSLAVEFKDRVLEGDVFVTHTHWDHIQGWPFFIPAYLPRNRFRVHGAVPMGATFEKVFRDQMSHHYFPVEIMDMSAKLEFHQVSGAFESGPAKVTPFYTNHPGVCMAYRFDFPGANVVYLTDHENHQGQSDTELSIKQDQAILEFCKGADLLIADSQYNDEEYQFKRGWGHSRWKDSLALGVATGAKRLAFFHHEPMRSDDHIDAVVREARERLRAAGSKLDCFAAQEGLEIPL